MRKVYIVTTGSYSDYRIEEVFDKEENAVEYMIKEDLYDSNVEVYNLNKNSLVKKQMAKLSCLKYVYKNSYFDYVQCNGFHPMTLVGYDDCFKNIFVEVRRIGDFSEEKLKKICDDIISETFSLIEIEGFDTKMAIEMMNLKYGGS